MDDDNRGHRQRVKSDEAPQVPAPQPPQAWHEHIFLANPDAIIVTDAEGRIVDWNGAAERSFGYERAEMVGQMLTSFYLTEDAPTLVAELRESLTRAGKWSGQMMFARKDAPPAVCETTITLLQDEHQRVTGAFGIYRDITASHQRERELREQAEQLQAIFETAADPLFFYDAQGTMLRSNAAARRLLPAPGVPHDFHVRDATGRPLAQEAWPLAHLLRGETLANDGAAEVLMRLPNGRDAWLSYTGSPLHDKQGRLMGIIASARDVTERHRLDQRTHAALEAFIAITRALVEVPDDVGATPTDSAGPEEPHQHPLPSPLMYRLTELTRGILGCQIVAVTTAEEVDGRLYDWPVALAGMPPEQERQWWTEQMAARPLEVGAGLLPQDRARLLAGDVVILDLTRPPYGSAKDYGITTLLWTAMRAQGRIVGFIALNFLDPDGQPHTFTPEEMQIAEAVARLGAVVLERDRLLRDRAEAQARELAAVEAARRMDEFLAIASHELRTPLTIIKTNVQVAARRVASLHPPDAPANETGKDDDDPRARHDSVAVQHLTRLLENTVTAVSRQERLIQDLLDVSRIAASKLEYRMEVCDLAALVTEVIEEQRLVAGGRVIMEAMAAIPALVYADPDRIRQVVANFVNNALKYSPPDQPFTVRLLVTRNHLPDGQGNSMRVEVQDAGPGLTPAQQRHLFERFYRVPEIAVQSGSGVGLGLGLYICKTIIERHGGALGVTSRRGHGATFWFTLPGWENET